MTHQVLIAVGKFYAEYVIKTFEEKLHAGELLKNGGKLLLEIDQKQISREDLHQRRYLTQKIAGDLLRQVTRMSRTKQYDTAPMLEEYTYLSLELAIECCESDSDRRLIPFLAPVLYYENFNEDKSKYYKLRDMYERCVKLEHQYSQKLICSDSPICEVDTWNF